MADRCLIYYITDRSAFPGEESARRSRLLVKIAEAARCGVDYIQLREKDLPSRELEILAREAVQAIHERRPLRIAGPESSTRLLINSRTDVALAVGVDGVQLRSDDVFPSDVRVAWDVAAGPILSRTRGPVIGVSCHSVDEVLQAALSGASFALFAPVFEKKDSPSTQSAGLASLRNACRTSIPVIALGGVTLENAESCLEAGAAGIAAIRLFQENDIGEVVRKLRL